MFLACGITPTQMCSKSLAEDCLDGEALCFPPDFVVAGCLHYSLPSCVLKTAIANGE